MLSSFPHPFQSPLSEYLLILFCQASSVGMPMFNIT
jgi:hypothetical protein